MNNRRHTSSDVTGRPVRVKPSRRRFHPRNLLWRLGFVAPFAMLVLAAIAAPLAVSANGRTAWQGTIDDVPGYVPTQATVGSISDGTDGLADFTYYSEICPNRPDSCGGTGISGAWTFWTVSDTTGRLRLDWSWTGHHSYFQVTTGLHLFARDDFDQQLVADGPKDCEPCPNPPSGGFTYSGTEYIDVTEGDLYGFKITGSNGDLNAILQGTLRVGTNIVSNGSFELGTPEDEGGYTRLTPGSTALTDWTVDPARVSGGVLPNTGDVDWTGARWEAKEGARSLELDGGPSSGGIYQDLPTVNGQQYNIEIWYSANPDRQFVADPPPECAVMDPAPAFFVTWGGDQLGGVEIPFSTANNTENMQWAHVNFAAYALSSTTRLEIASTDEPNRGCGIVVDDVSVIPVVPTGGPAVDPVQGVHDMTVNTALDHSGDCTVSDCSLREAILLANFLGDDEGAAYHIGFDIDGSRPSPSSRRCRPSASR